MGPSVTDSLIKTLWSSCQFFGVTIQDDFGDLTLLRKGDQFLMPTFYAKYSQDPTTLRQLNQCRMFLHSVTVADLTTLEGESRLVV